MASSSTTQQRTSVFDPRIAFPAATDSLLNGLRGNFNQHIDWLDSYLQQVKEADVLRVKSTNIPSRASPSHLNSDNIQAQGEGLWHNILKSPARKRVKETNRQQQDVNDYSTSNKPISSLSYSASKQKNIFSNTTTTDNFTASAVSRPPLSKSGSSSGSLSRSPAKTGLKGLAHINTYIEGDKENAPLSSSLSRSISSNRVNNSSSENTTSRPTPLNRSITTGNTPNSRKNVLSATARSPGIRSPLQASTSKAQRQPTQNGSSSNLSASAPASPLRSPGHVLGYQSPYLSPLTRSQRLTQTTSEADAAPSTTAPSTVASTTSASRAQQERRHISPSPTPRPASRVLRSPTASTAGQQHSAPASPRQGRLLSPLAAGLSKIATPKATSGVSHKAAASANTTPIKVVDDVFMLSTDNEAEAEDSKGESSKGTDFDEDDEEEIENILLGYTSKTPATATANKVLKSEPVRNGAKSTAPSTVSVVVEVPIREKALPAIPQQSNTNNSAKPPASRISPPRPAKSPARAVSAATSNNTYNNAGKGVISNISPSKITRPTGGSQFKHYSPVKRDMSHLASIASLLSPTKAIGEERREAHTSRPASPQPRAQSKVPVPQASMNNSPARPRSPLPGSVATNANDAATPSPSSRPVSPSRISSRIAALAGAARGASSRDASPKAGNTPSQPTSPRFGLTRSPRLKQALRLDSPASPARTRENVSQSSNATSAPAPSGLPTPTKMKRPMLSPIQSPNSQRALALSSLRKAVPGFETNAFTSPPASPRLPSTNSISTNIHHFQPVISAKNAHIQEEKMPLSNVNSQLQKDEDLIEQHARAISALGKSLPPAPVQQNATETRSTPTGLSPPAKSPLRKLNSQLGLNTHAATSPASGENAHKSKTVAPTPSKDGNETVMPQTVVKKVETEAVHSTAHKDTTVDIPPPSPMFSSFLSNNNKRTSTLSFAGLPGRTFAGPGGREKSVGLGLGLGKSLGATSAAAKERLAQAEEQESQGSSNAAGHNRQSFYTAALASQSRKRLSSTLSQAGVLGVLDADSQGSKASRTEFSQTARSSILASQMQQQQQPMSQSARFDLLRSRISNIKGTTGYIPPSASLRTSMATAHPPMAGSSSQAIGSSTASKADTRQSEKLEVNHDEKGSVAQSMFSPPAHASTATVPKSTLPSSATSTFAATIASFVPAPAFGTSFASLFGAGSLRATKPESPAKDTHKQNSTSATDKKTVEGSLYPSLPSMNNLHLPLASFTSPLKLHGKGLHSETDEEQIEELASPLAGEDIIDRARAVPPSSPPAMLQRSRSSSVQSIVDAIEAKEAEARQERQREASLSPRKVSGVPSISTSVQHTSNAHPARSTTPTLSPPKQDLLPRLSYDQGGHRTSSRPESRLSDMPVMPLSDSAGPDLSIAGLVDIEDPGLDAIPRASFSDDTELPTTDAVSETEDEDMDQADDEEDLDDVTSTRQHANDRQLDVPVGSKQHHSAQPSGSVRPAVVGAGNLSKSTFKPTRPARDTSEVQRPVHRPPSRAPSVTSLAPSRTSTISLASSSTYNPSRPGTSMSTNNNRKAGNLSVSSNARPEIKSLQNAAAAAKKEQMDKERKAAIKEERDQKRAAFLAAKRGEQDPQSSQGHGVAAEKKRKDRDDLNSSMAASSQGSTVVKAKTIVKTSKTTITTNKVSDDQPKKRKMDAVEVVIQKPAVPKTTVTRIATQKTTATSRSTVNNGTTAGANTSIFNAKALAASVSSIGLPMQAQSSGSTRLVTQASTSKAPLQPTKPTGHQQALLSQHQQAILSASMAFGKSQPAGKASTSQQPQAAEEPEVEPFQLPEIDSEYSDSDEDVQAQKAALRPVWTHSPELRQALAVQARFDPDQLFGEMPALKMEEIFRNPATIARLRHRTSSAHWSGPDAISRYEEKEYAKRMGFRRGQEGSEQQAPESGPSNSKRM